MRFVSPVFIFLAVFFSAPANAGDYQGPYDDEVVQPNYQTAYGPSYSSYNYQGYGAQNPSDHSGFDRLDSDEAKQIFEYARADAINLVAAAMSVDADPRIAAVYKKLQSAKIRKGTLKDCFGGSNATVNGQTVTIPQAAAYANPSSGTIYLCQLPDTSTMIHEAIHLAKLFKVHGHYDECATEDFRRLMYQYSGTRNTSRAYQGFCDSGEGYQGTSWSERRNY